MKLNDIMRIGQRINVDGKRLKNVKREFSLIPIVCPDYPGFGDVVSSLRIAQGMKKEFPDIPIEIYYTSHESYEKHLKLMLEGINNIKAQVLDGKSLIKKLRNQRVCIKYLGPNEVTTRSPQWSRGALNASFNVYVTEHDLSEGERKAEQNELSFGILSEDQYGNRHLPLFSGFDIAGAGLILPPERIKIIEPSQSNQNKRDLIFRTGLGKNTNEKRTLFYRLEDPCDIYGGDTWGFSYVLERSSPFNGVSACLEDLATAYSEINPLKRVIIFDFQDFDPKYFCFNWGREKYKKAPFEQHFVWDEGYLIINNAVKANIVVYHLGNQPHSVFQSFMTLSDLPPVVTGDASMTEALSTGRPFLYEPPNHKVLVLSNLQKYIETNLPQHKEFFDFLLINNYYSEFRKWESNLISPYRNLQSIFSPQGNVAFKQLSNHVYASHNFAKNAAALIRTSLET